MKKKTCKRFACLLAVLVLLGAAGCGSAEKSTEAYVKKIEPFVRLYLDELTRTALGEVPEMTVGVRYPSADLAKKEAGTIEEILAGDPVLLIGMKQLSEQQIHDLLKEAADRGIVIQFAFNGDDSRLYKVENGKVTVDEATGKDGGAYRVESEYPL